MSSIGTVAEPWAGARPFSILVVAEDPGVRDLARASVGGSAGCELHEAVTLGEALARVAAGPVDAVLLELGLPDVLGLDGLRRLVEVRSDLPVVVVAGPEHRVVPGEAILAGAHDCLFKGQLDRPLLKNSLLRAVERRRAEQALRPCEAGSRGPFERPSAACAYCEVQYEGGRPVDWTFLAVSRAFEAVTGCSGVAGKRLTELVPGVRGRDPGLLELCSRVALDGEPASFDLCFAEPGPRFHVSARAREKGRFSAIFHAIDGRAPVERREAEPRPVPRVPGAVEIAEAVLDGVQLGLVVIDRDHRIVMTNAFHDRWLRHRPGEALGQRCYGLIHGRDAPCPDCACTAVFRTGAPARACHTGLDATGAVTHAEITALPLRDARGEIAWALELVHDVSERVRHEEQLAALVASLSASEARYRAIYEGSKDAILVSTPEEGFVAANPAALALFECADEREILSRRFTDFSPELQPDGTPSAEKGQAMRALALEKGSHSFEWVYRTRRGREVPAVALLTRIELHGKPAVHATIRDVSEQRRLERQLLQAQRMEAIGQLAGGVAHDFNNLLTGILGYGDLALARLAPEDELHRHLAEIRRCAQRGASLTRQLLAFSRQQVLAPKVIDLRQVVEGLEPMLRRLIGENVELVTVAAPDVGVVLADPGQVEQVIMNLVVNSRDALPGRGRITIATSNVDLDLRHVREHPDAGVGPHVRLAVTDDGVGMDAATKARLFEPFFTTKEPGKGTGLGLSTVYGIVRQSGGSVACESELGRGTTFEVFLPRVSGEAAKPTLGSAAEIKLPAGTATILLVDDDDVVAAVNREILEGHGFEVLAAASGAEALAVLSGHAGPVPLLVSDVGLPGMSGPELAREVRARRPGTAVLFVSGYPADELARQGVLAADVELLQKPFTPNALVRRVQAILGAGGRR